VTLQVMPKVFEAREQLNKLIAQGEERGHIRPTETNRWVWEYGKTIVLYIDALETRLEMNSAYVNGERVAMKPGSIPDGIECRDETIKLQKEYIKQLENMDREAR